MNEQQAFEELVSRYFNNAIQNQGNRLPMPGDQQEKERKVLDAIHDICSNMKDIKTIYRPQVQRAMILKLAEERGIIGGQQR